MDLIMVRLQRGGYTPDQLVLIIEVCLDYENTIS